VLQGLRHSSNSALLFWDKTRQERMIAKSNVEWVIVRPNVLTKATSEGAAFRHYFGVQMDQKDAVASIDGIESVKKCPKVV
jgi:hypothetical protein